MKRVETININGIVFSINDDAFGKLNVYLHALNRNFEQEQGGREIIADIEARISELFTERNGSHSEVVTLDDVLKVIETLGTPEDISGADEEFENENTPPPRPTKPHSKSQRRLYRDPDQRYIGGVCAGLSTWLGITPVILRLVFVIFVLFPFPGFIFSIFHTHGFHRNGLSGFFILIYCILWFIIPKAKTTAQKLEMRGEPVNISNIEKNIKESLSDPALKQSFHNFLDEFSEFWVRVFGVFGRIIAFFVGLILLCLGVGFAISFISFSFLQDIAFNRWVEWDFLSFTELFRHIISPTSYTLLLICVILITTMFIFALLFWGVKLISGIKVRHKLLHVSLFILWMLIFFMGIMVCISTARSFAWRNEQIVETLQITSADTLYLALSPSKLQISNNPMDIYYDKDNSCFYGKPILNIQKSDDGQTRLRYRRESQGENKRAARQHAENITYLVNVHDSLLLFDPFFTVIPQDRWKFQTLDMTLYVPEGTIVVADEALCNDRILGRYWRWRSSEDCIWVMTENKGLQRVKNDE